MKRNTQPKPGQLVAVRKAPDAQLYYYAHLIGDSAWLQYMRGNNLVSAQIDVCFIRRPTKAQLVHSAAQVEELLAKTSK